MIYNVFGGTLNLTQSNPQFYMEIFVKFRSSPQPQGQYWAGKTPHPNNGLPNMAAANFVVITNGEGCALNGTAVATVFINQ